MSSDKKLVKPASLIVELSILDGYGREIKKPYKIQNGPNEFSCQATYVDGSQEIFAAYWTCPMVLPRGGVDFYGAIGTQKHSIVEVNVAPNHLRYPSLACWVKFPVGDSHSDADQYPHATIEFDYSEVSHG